MTGYGRAEKSVNEKLFLVELRSLNGKQFELLLKPPAQLKPYEFEIRNMLSEQLIRGSIECTISIKQNGAARPSSINLELLSAYYTQLKGLSSQLGADDSQLLSSLLRLPEVVASSTEMLSEDEWHSFQGVLQEAIDQLNIHRVDEGKALEADLISRIANIEVLQVKLMTFEPMRKEKIRESILKHVEEQVGKDSVDMNRFEQELIYYIEKIDLSEEQVRLTNHCTYFRELLTGNETAKGRKLSFLLQEIGREINTTGSKAYDAAIQKCVVEMKDELEKAKEQVLNIL
jgi:uncharacterized protein (TIGR00255 family)